MAKSLPSRYTRWAALILIFLAVSTVITYLAREMTSTNKSTVIDDYKVWDEAVIDAASSLPVQNGGRVKPFSTYANFEMLRLYGARSMKFTVNDEKVKISPTEWLLDIYFRPEVAIKQPTFRVDNSEVLEAIGVHATEKRDRYSYEQLEQYSDRLTTLATEAERKLDQKGPDGKAVELPRLDRQILDLGRNYRAYEAAILYFTFARVGIELKGEGGEGSVVRTSAVMQTADEILSATKRYTDPSQIPSHLRDVISQITRNANFAKYGLFILPPSEEGKWQSAGEAIFEVTTGASENKEQAIADILRLEKLAVAGSKNDSSFAKELSDFRSHLLVRAEKRGEGTEVKSENSYNNFKYFLNGLVFFMTGFFFLAIMWLSGKSKVSRILSGCVWLFSLLGFICLLSGIVHRAFIMDRFPIGNLFETIPFITGAACFTAVFIELLTRRRIFLSLIPILGMLGLFFARKFELSDGVDNMDPLVAVLNSNFWLSTHVFTIVSGYGAGLITGFISLVYVLMRILGLDEGDAKTRRTLTRAAYGCVCFTLFLSLIGTVLGGIWANDSWGRFWGWDPKENGALMIVLWNLFILHARMGGYLKEWGLHLAAIFGMAIIVFSWWHVNILGVGLHSYGFAEDSKRAMVWNAYYAIISVVAIGFIYSRVEKRFLAWVSQSDQPETAEDVTSA